MGEPVLCYVDKNWAYFTTQKLKDQWGDDWDDKAYEHNSEPPYGPSIHYFSDGHTEKDPRDWNADGTPKWDIIKVAFDGAFKAPCDGVNNSDYSVEQINAGAVAWLRSSQRCKNQKAIIIPAGTTLNDFVKKIREGGGNVYLPVPSEAEINKHQVAK